MYITRLTYWRHDYIPWYQVDYSVCILRNTHWLEWMESYFGASLVLDHRHPQYVYTDWYSVLCLIHHSGGGLHRDKLVALCSTGIVPANQPMMAQIISSTVYLVTLCWGHLHWGVLKECQDHLMVNLNLDILWIHEGMGCTHLWLHCTMCS